MASRTVNIILSARCKQFAIVAARFNSAFSDRLVEGATEAILLHGGSEDSITIVRVPGSYELPLACLEAAQTQCFDAVIAVGVLIRGETDHYDLIAGQAAAGIADASRQTGVPITFGVVTAENTEQAIARSGGKVGNIGYNAAVAAVEMISVIEQLRQLPSVAGVCNSEGKV